MSSAVYCTEAQLLEHQHLERIFQDDNKYVLVVPPEYADIWKMYKTQEGTMWKREEVDIMGDLEAWKELDPNKKFFIKMILAFFAASDGIVNENLSTNFANEIQIACIRAYYTAQQMIESVHSETYSALIESYIEDDEERDVLFRAIENFECVRKKANWAQKWMNSDIPFAVRLVAFCVVEGIFFSGSFCAIFWLKDQNINMKGLFSANEFISRDEGLHTDAAVMIFKKLKYIPSEEIIHNLFEDAIAQEIEFINDAISCDMIGMNKGLMSDYIKFVGDRLLCQLGYNRIYNVKNPFVFMERINLDNISNFHTRRVTEYARSQKIEKIKNASDFYTDGDF